MTVTKHNARRGHRGRWMGAALGLAMIASIGVGTQAASADTTHSATRTGEHSVCAQTLNQYVYANNAWSVVTATNGTGYYVTSFLKPNWVYGYSRGTHKWGYVHNGWFC